MTAREANRRSRPERQLTPVKTSGSSREDDVSPYKRTKVTLVQLFSLLCRCLFVCFFLNRKDVFNQCIKLSGGGTAVSGLWVAPSISGMSGGGTGLSTKEPNLLDSSALGNQNRVPQKKMSGNLKEVTSTVVRPRRHPVLRDPPALHVTGRGVPPHADDATYYQPPSHRSVR